MVSFRAQSRKIEKVSLPITGMSVGIMKYLTWIGFISLSNPWRNTPGSSSKRSIKWNDRSGKWTRLSPINSCQTPNVTTSLPFESSQPWRLSRAWGIWWKCRDGRFGRSHRSPLSDGQKWGHIWSFPDWILEGSVGRDATRYSFGAHAPNRHTISGLNIVPNIAPMEIQSHDAADSRIWGESRGNFRLSLLKTNSGKRMGEERRDTLFTWKSRYGRDRRNACSTARWETIRITSRCVNCERKRRVGPVEIPQKTTEPPHDGV